MCLLVVLLSHSKTVVLEEGEVFLVVRAERLVNRVSSVRECLIGVKGGLRHGTVAILARDDRIGQSQEGTMSTFRGGQQLLNTTL